MFPLLFMYRVTIWPAAIPAILFRGGRFPVMATLHDDMSLPKFMAFGVYKPTNQRLTKRTRYAGYAEIAATPLHMIPGQAQLSRQHGDTCPDPFTRRPLLRAVDREDSLRKPVATRERVRRAARPIARANGTRFVLQSSPSRRIGDDQADR